MTIYDEVEDFLRAEPKARERKNKEKAIRILLINQYPVLKQIDKTTLSEIFKAYASYDRAWRKTTEEHTELRGTDYYDKFKLEDAKRQELGYPTRL